MNQIKNQDLAGDFISANLEKILKIKNIDCLSFYDPEKGIYQLGFDADDFFRKIMLEYVEVRANRNITVGTVNDIINQVKLKTMKQVDNLASPYIAFKDQLLNLEECYYYPFSPDRPCYYSIPYTVEEIEKAETPSLFLSFLDKVIIDEKGKSDAFTIGIIQEMFGYMFFPTNKAEKSFFIVGSGANGKSVLLHILSAALGEHYVSAKSIETLTSNRFATSSLVSKRVNICTEEESKYLKSDKFKAMVSGESMEFEQKFGRTLDAKLNTKFIFATNEIPSFEGFNKGLLRRIIIIPFNYTVKDEERNVFLAETIIKNELKGVINWAIEGLKRLITNQFVFSSSEAVMSSGQKFKNFLSSASLYITENYTEDIASFITNQALYDDYANWCDARRKKAVNYYRFLNDLKEVLLFPAPSSPHWIDGKTQRGRCLKRKSEEWGGEESDNTLNLPPL